jgi:protein O-mannosyl-transferase
MLKKVKLNLVRYFPWIVIILGILVYGAALFNGFVWDDEEQVVNNIAIRSLSNIPYLFSQSTFNTGGSAGMGGMYYKPMMPLLFTLIYQFSRLNAWGYHLVQVIFHLANVYLIYLILKKFIRPLFAALASLLFLVHPANVESVAYISGLQDVLFMFFGLLAFWLVLQKKTLSEKHWLLTFVLLLAALLSKETGVLFLLLLPAYFFWFNKKALRPYFLYLSLLVCLYLILRFGVASISANSQKVYPIMVASFWERLVTIPKIMFNYLRLIFFPFGLAISQNWSVKQISWSEFYLPFIVNTVFFLGLLTLLWRLKKPIFWFFGFLLIIGLGMHSQLVPLDMTMSERWLYFPLFAVLAIIYVLIDKYKSNSNIIVIISLVIIAIFSVRSFCRVLDWKDGLTLYSKDESLAKGSFDFENNLGVYLLRAGKRGRAQQHYLKSTQVAPHWWTNWNNLGVTYQAQGKLALAERAYLRAISNGDYYLAYENYASLLFKQKKYQKLIAFLEGKALPKFPYNQKLQELYQFTKQKNAR